jgi:hypothetical protein
VETLTPAATRQPKSATLVVTVAAPHHGRPSAADLRRLLGVTMKPERRERLHRSTRILVESGRRLVGFAGYDRTNSEIRVRELVIDPGAGPEADRITASLVNALELTCLAAGCHKVVLLPRSVAALPSLTRLGYHVVAEGCGGTWLEKALP